MRKRSARAIVVMLAAAITLSGCGITGPLYSPAPSATDAPTPTPTPEAPVAASVAISTESIAVLDATGASIASFDYFQPTAEVVVGLSEYLGAPVDSPNPGGNESPPGIDHVWGDLRLSDTDTPGTAPENPNHFVFVEGTSAGPLPIATAAGVGSAVGVRVGDPVTSLTLGAELAATRTDPATGRTSETYWTDMVPITLGESDPSSSAHLAVMVVANSVTGLIELFAAPTANFGA